MIFVAIVLSSDLQFLSLGEESVRLKTILRDHSNTHLPPNARPLSTVHLLVSFKKSEYIANGYMVKARFPTDYHTTTV